MAVEIAVRCSVCKDYVDPDDCAHVSGTVRNGYRGDLIADGEYVLCSVECLAKFLGLSSGFQVRQGEESPVEEAFNALPGGVEIPDAGAHLSDAEAEEEEEEKEIDEPPPPPPPPGRPKSQKKKVQAVQERTPYEPPEDIRYLFEHPEPVDRGPVHGADSIPAHLRDTIVSGDELTTFPYAKSLESRIRRSLPQGAE